MRLSDILENTVTLKKANEYLDQFEDDLNEIFDSKEQPTNPDKKKIWNQLRGTPRQMSVLTLFLTERILKLNEDISSVKEDISCAKQEQRRSSKKLKKLTKSHDSQVKEIKQKMESLTDENNDLQGRLDEVVAAALISSIQYLARVCKAEGYTLDNSKLVHEKVMSDQQLKRLKELSDLINWDDR